MPSIFDANIYDDFFGVGGSKLPNGKRKSSRSGYCEHCHRHHSVDFVHDVIGTVVGVSLLGFTISTLGAAFSSLNQ